MLVEEGSDSWPRSVLGVTSGDAAGGGATGATGFGRGIGLLGGDAGFTEGAGLADDAAAAPFAGAFLGAAFFGAAFFAAAFLAFLATFALLAFLAGRPCFFFLAMLFLAEARFALAAERFFPLAFFFAMVSHLLAVIGLHVRVALKKSAVISRDAGVDD